MSTTINPPYAQGARVNRTVFVTLLAWIMIVFSGIGLVLSLAYNGAIRIFFTKEKLNELLDKQGISIKAPSLDSLYNYLGIILIVVLVFFLLRFVAAIFLLKRKNWSRILHMVYFVFALFFYLFVLAMMILFLYFGGDEGVSDLQRIDGTITSVGTIIMGAILVFCGIYIAGLIRLSSEKVRNEFS